MIFFTKEQFAEVEKLPKDVSNEYFMERRYHGVSHDEALERAWKSSWIISKKEEDK